MLPIVTAPLEASAIAIKTLDVTTEKPLTIDVAKCILEELGGNLARVIIDAETGGALFAVLEITVRGMLRKITCRPCDAIALALRCEAPLFTRETVLEAVGSNAAGKKDPRNEADALRTGILHLDTLEFGRYHPE